VEYTARKHVWWRTQWQVARRTKFAHLNWLP